jgi:hypothetical protein
MRGIELLPAGVRIRRRLDGALSGSSSNVFGSCASNTREEAFRSSLVLRNRRFVRPGADQCAADRSGRAANHPVSAQ